MAWPKGCLAAQCCTEIFGEKREGAMKSGVRVLKRGRNYSSKSLTVEPSEKTDRQSNREIVITVKSWISEFNLLRLSRRTEALRLLK
jgi:hypothetical protein